MGSAAAHGLLDGRSHNSHTSIANVSTTGPEPQPLPDTRSDQAFQSHSLLFSSVTTVSLPDTTFSKQGTQGSETRKVWPCICCACSCSLACSQENPMHGCATDICHQLSTCPVTVSPSYQLSGVVCTLLRWCPLGNGRVIALSSLDMPSAQSLSDPYGNVEWSACRLWQQACMHIVHNIPIVRPCPRPSPVPHPNRHPSRLPCPSM
jgi:hypothetical protein